MASSCEETLEGYLSTAGQGVEFCQEIVKSVLSEQETLNIHLHEKQILEANILSHQMNGINNSPLAEQIAGKSTQINGNLDRMMQLKTVFLNNIKLNLGNISGALAILQEKMSTWSHQQQHEANGYTIPDKVPLEVLQGHCELIAYLLWTSRQQLQEAQGLQSRSAIFATSSEPVITGQTSSQPKSEVEFLLEDVLRMLKILLNTAFVVESQPPQIVKRGNKIRPETKVSLLLGNSGIHMASPTVSAKLIVESQVGTLLATDDVSKVQIRNDDKLLNSSSKLQASNPGPRLTSKFSQLQLKERPEKKNSKDSKESKVSEEKCCFLFESCVDLCDLKITIRTLSYPVCVTTHTSQMDSAMGAIMYDHQFGVKGRLTFEVPSEVWWSELGDLISRRFVIHTGRGLNQNQLLYIKKKLTGLSNLTQYFSSASPVDDQTDVMISWENFAKTPYKSFEFGIWSWVYFAMRLIANNFKDIWKAGLIMGFVESSTAESLLRGKRPGTFLIRFSESVQEGIVFVCVRKDGTPVSVTPLGPKILKAFPLANVIRDKPEFQYLYPSGIHKDDYQAFKKFYSDTSNSNYPVNIWFNSQTDAASSSNPCIEGEASSRTMAEFESGSPHSSQELMESESTFGQESVEEFIHFDYDVNQPQPSARATFQTPVLQDCVFDEDYFEL